MIVLRRSFAVATATILAANGVHAAVLGNPDNSPLDLARSKKIRTAETILDRKEGALWRPAICARLEINRLFLDYPSRRRRGGRPLIELLGLGAGAVVVVRRRRLT